MNPHALQIVSKQFDEFCTKLIREEITDLDTAWAHWQRVAGPILAYRSELVGIVARIGPSSEQLDALEEGDATAKIDAAVLDGMTYLRRVEHQLIEMLKAADDEAQESKLITNLETVRP